ncbi:MAG TPA: glutamate--tRNA ligase family protein, partial [Terriglobia bacterium]|nr:glutamate--tRNA ligase family protein [Terriglobia bacterium]
ARRHGGQFILRIDDTDQQRNVKEALDPILHGFRWLGLDWDEGAEIGGSHGPYYQSQKLPRYQEAVRQLVASGHAYWDYANEEEMKSERQAAEKEKRQFQYSRRWMAETDADRARFESEGRKGVVRLKMPREGKCVFDDHVRGRVEVEWTQEPDHVIQRADGSALYNLANVVDDYDMQITHVIRASEHLSNTPRQIFIAQGLGYTPPQYAHVPFVAEPGSKNKLSKRKIADYLKNHEFRKLYEHGERIAQALGLQIAAETFNPVIVDFYEKVGYLSDAIVNYMVLIGWSLDDKTEFFTRKEMIENFSLERINRAPASFDAKKLFSFQERYMNLLSIDEKTAMTTPYLQQAGLSPDPEKVKQIVAAAADRIKVAGDILEYTTFFIPAEQLIYDEVAFDKRLQTPPEAAGLLKRFADRLKTLEPFDAPTIEKDLQDFVQAEGVTHAQIIHSLRLAATGKTVGFGLFDTLAILGRTESLRRIEQALGRI